MKFTARTRPGLQKSGEAELYLDARTGAFRYVTDTTDAAVGGTGGGGGVTDHTALTSLTWASSGHTGTASSLAGFDSGGAATTYYPADLEIRCDANPTLATGYEIVRGYLRTAHQYTTTTARNIAATSPEYGWTWANRTNLGTANENTTTANAVYGLVTSTNTDWYSATTTAPYRYQTVWWDGRPLEVIALVYSNGNANYESAGICIARDSTPTAFVRASVGASAGSPAIQNVVGAGSVAAGITSAQRDAGVWFRTVLYGPFSASQVMCTTAYNLTASASPPTSWTRLDIAPISSMIPFETIRVGQIWTSTNTAAHLAGGCKWFGWRFLDRPPPEMTAPTFFHGRQYDTSASAQTLIASFDLGTSTAAISDTELRAALAAAENHMDDDSGASWTYSAVRGSSPSPAAGSYSAAASVSVSGTGRYFALYAKCTSDGATHGSFNLGGFRLRATV